MVLRVTDRLLGPVIVVLSVFFLLRGHNAPGGGFISALIGAAGIALVYLAAQDDRVSRIRVPYTVLIGAGVLVGVGVGLLGLADGSFLRPLHFYVLGVHVTTALLFDVGVYLAVVGVVLAAISRLGVEEAEPPPVRRAGATSSTVSAARTATTGTPHAPSTAPTSGVLGTRDRTRPPRQDAEDPFRHTGRAPGEER
jgi:multicomponent Na+:H+ antiporter subunit A